MKTLVVEILIPETVETTTDERDVIAVVEPTRTTLYLLGGEVSIEHPNNFTVINTSLEEYKGESPK